MRNKSNRILAGYITPEQLTHELDRSLITLARWRHKRIGPRFIKVGKQVFYSKESVRRWLERLETRPEF